MSDVEKKFYNLDIIFHIALMIINITSVKFVSIFVVKNPLGIKTDFWAQCYKTFYVRNLQMFVAS